jgi:signal transduction histidine kinase/CheY-like chemotaxis protein
MQQSTNSALNPFVKNNKSFLVGSNVANNTHFDRDKVINNLVIARATALVMFAIMTAINYFNELSYSYITTAAVLLVLIPFKVTKKNYKIVRILIIASTSIAICFTSYFEGMQVGNYLFLFNIFAFCMFVHSFTDRKSLFFSYGLVLVSFILIVSFVPQIGVIYKTTGQMAQFSFVTNLLFSLIIMLVLSFAALRVNDKQAKDLVAEQTFLDNIYNTSLDAIFLVDANTNKIVNCNQHALTIFNGSDKNEFLNKPISNYFKVVDFFEKKKNKNWQGEAACVGINNFEFTGYVSFVKITHDGEVVYKLNILDISKIKQYEKDLIVAKEKAEVAAKTKSSFLSNMSHELRTPLNAIIGTVNILEGEVKLHHQKEYFDRLVNTSNHMLELINSILDISKIEAAKLKLELRPFNLAQLAHKLHSLFIGQFQQKSLELHFDVDSSCNQPFIGDETKLTQVLANLISNALKFTDSGKVSVSIKIKNETFDKAAIFFSVLDTGIGIDEKNREVIFQTFSQGDTSTTRKYGGTGLGLSISKEIVKLFRGDLFLVSEVGEGSQFFFTINLEKDLVKREEPKEIIAPTVEKKLEGVRVLLVEDNKLNMIIAEKFLSNWKATIAKATNGLEAIDLLDKESFDVALVDLEMPELDGFGTLRAMQQRNLKLPAIAFTAAIYDNIAEDLKQKGFADYLQKPFKPETLLSKVQDAVAKK